MVDYTRLVAVLIERMKEQQEQIDGLRVLVEQQLTDKKLFHDVSNHLHPNII